MQTPFKTPDGFFESHRKDIWDAAQSNAHNKPKAPLAIAAAVAAVIVGTWFFTVLNQSETCQTFACLWENTPSEELQFSEEDLDQWIQDDLLFQEIMESEALL